MAGSAHAQDTGFRWSWQQDEDAAPSAPTTPVAPKADAAHYAELLKENEALRERVEQAERERLAIEAANRDLARQVRDMEQRLTGMTGLIDRLNKEKTISAGDASAQARLQQELDEAEREKATLAESLAALRDRERELQANLEHQRQQAEEAERVRRATPAIPQESALFRDLQTEHRTLQQRLAALEQEQALAVKARDQLLRQGEQADEHVRREAEKRKQLEAEIAEREQREREHKRMIADLLKQIPAMEKELETLRQETGQDRAGYSDAVNKVKTLTIELERRERQLQQSEHMARLLEESRAKVQQAAMQERRDIHYNMAVVYAREGRVKEAEAEYLKALRIDPADADTHFNLGILYEDKLGDSSRASRHYRKYLELNPTSSDADKVRLWMIRIESQPNTPTMRN